ncbi:MAG: Fur family transcriptional regulator [Thermoplasma acidophilum]|nr:Fur family transcriptional regulator [Thermoplasma acidophilum]
MVKDYVTMLKEAGYKITPQRLAVIEYLKKGPGHFTANDVYKEIKKSIPTITLATVYNILKAFADVRCINSFDVDGTTWFENEVELHANLMCKVCGNIVDVKIDKGKLLDLLRENSDADFENITLFVRGVCPDCKAKEKQEMASTRPIVH